MIVFGFGNFETEGCFGRREGCAAYPFKAEGLVMVYSLEIPY